MRSNHLARLAGISVRTLRHYHQVGVLAEPARSSNGYRDYNTHDLVKILRIRRLADLGFTLAQISSILQDTGPTPKDLFERLDTELAEQIQRLNGQRQLLAHLQHHGVAPDLPPEIAASHDLLRQSGLPEHAARTDRDNSLLLAQLLGEHGQAYLAVVYELLSRPDRAPAAAAAMTAWAGLGDQSTDQDIANLVDELTELFVPVLVELTAEGAQSLPSLTEAQLQEHTTDYITAAQRRVLEQVRAELSSMLR